MSNEPLNTIASPEKLRLFLALFPTPQVLARLETAQKKLQQKLSAREIRWTKPEQIHLTLHFFGHVNRDKIELFEKTIETVTRSVWPFEIRAEHLGCFPSLKHPRILWTGLSDDEHALETLKTKLDHALGEIGCEIETRKFHPHLTLARIGELRSRDAREFSHEISDFGAEGFGTWRVEEIQLMRSTLSSKGASYFTLRNFPLN